MTENQLAALVVSRSACAIIRSLGMMAENQQRAVDGFAMAYTEDAFKALIEESSIFENAVIALFNNQN